MSTPAPVSPEIKQAKDLYNSTRRIASFGLFFLIVVLTVAINVSVARLGWGKAPPFFVVFIYLITPFSEAIARRRVQAAGLLKAHVTVEIIPKTATDFAGGPVEWPGGTRSKAEAVALASLALMPCLAGWGMWRYMDDYWPVQVEGVLLFVGCLVIAVPLFYNSSPSLLIDETGITTAPKAPWRRRVQWKDIDHYEILRTTSIYGTNRQPWVLLKDSQGKLLLKLYYPHRQSLPLPGRPDERVEIETEIKRRLSGEPVPTP